MVPEVSGMSREERRTALNMPTLEEKGTRDMMTAHGFLGGQDKGNLQHFLQVQQRIQRKKQRWSQARRGFGGTGGEKIFTNRILDTCDKRSQEKINVSSVGNSKSLHDEEENKSRDPKSVRHSLHM